nr:hypothetical protein Iba_chr05bCG12080 [Ipomoea batatas]
MDVISTDSISFLRFKPYISSLTEVLLRQDTAPDRFSSVLKTEEVLLRQETDPDMFPSVFKTEGAIFLLQEVAMLRSPSELNLETHVALMNDYDQKAAQLFRSRNVLRFVRNPLLTGNLNKTAKLTVRR